MSLTRRGFIGAVGGIGGVKAVQAATVRHHGMTTDEFLGKIINDRAHNKAVADSFNAGLHPQVGITDVELAWVEPFMYMGDAWDACNRLDVMIWMIEGLDFYCYCNRGYDFRVAYAQHWSLCSMHGMEHSEIERMPLCDIYNGTPPHTNGRYYCIHEQYDANKMLDIRIGTGRVKMHCDIVRKCCGNIFTKEGL